MTLVEFTNFVIVSASCLAVGFGLGWYVKGRGVTGIQTDISNIKSDITNLKAKANVAQTPTPVAPTTTPAA